MVETKGLLVSKDAVVSARNSLKSIPGRIKRHRIRLPHVTTGVAFRDSLFTDPATRFLRSHIPIPASSPGPLWVHKRSCRLPWLHPSCSLLPLAATVPARRKLHFYPGHRPPLARIHRGLLCPQSSRSIWQGQFRIIFLLARHEIPSIVKEVRRRITKVTSLKAMTITLDAGVYST
jgi:hypothetical protein